MDCRDKVREIEPSSSLKAINEKLGIDRSLLLRSS